MRDYLLLSSVDCWLLEQPKIINARKRTYPVAIERQRLADGFTKRLQALGLQRRSRPVPSLSEYLEARAREASRDEEGDGQEAAEAAGDDPGNQLARLGVADKPLE